MWFGLKHLSTGDDEEELPLLLKKITTLELSNPKVSITPKKDFLFMYKTNYIN